MDDNAAMRPSAHSPVSITTEQPRPPARSFLNLPPEIRNIIYKWIFPKGPSAAQLLARRSGGYLQMSDRFTLLETCRQIHQEVSSLLRGEQRFVIKQPKTLIDVLDNDNEEIGQKIIQSIIPTGQIKIRYDLDQHTVSNDMNFLIQISKDFCFHVAKFTEVRITAAISVASDFQKLERWVQSGRAQVAMTDACDPVRSALIELQVLQTDDEYEENPMTDGAALLWAVRDLPVYAQVQTVVYDGSEKRKEDKQELHNVRAGLLLFIHRLIRKSPDAICPQIWLGKDLQVAFATLRLPDGSTERVSNKRADCSWHHIHTYLEAGDLIRHYRDAEGLQTHASLDEPFGKKTLLEVAKAVAGNLYTFFYI